MNSFQAERWRRWIRAPVRLRGEMMRPAACAKAEAAYNLIRPGRPLNSEARENFRRIAPTPSPSLQAAFLNALGLGPPHPALFRGAAVRRTVLENVLVAGPIGQTPLVAQNELGAPPARSDSAFGLSRTLQPRSQVTRVRWSSWKVAGLWESCHKL
jgi:hypothetical protein